MSTEFSDLPIKRSVPPPADIDPEDDIPVVFSRVTQLASTVTHPLCGSLAISQAAYSQFRRLCRGEFKIDERQSEVIAALAIDFGCTESIGNDRHHRPRLYDNEQKRLFIIGRRVLLGVIGDIETVACGVNGKRIPISKRAYAAFRGLCLERGTCTKETKTETIVDLLVAWLANSARRLRDDQSGNLVYTDWDTATRFIVDPEHYTVLMVYDMPNDDD